MSYFDELFILYLNNFSIWALDVAVIPSWCCIIETSYSAFVNILPWVSWIVLSTKNPFTNLFLAKLNNLEKALQIILSYGSVVKYPLQYLSWSQFVIRSNLRV